MWGKGVLAWSSCLLLDIFLGGVRFQSAEQDLMHADHDDFNCIIPQQALDSSGAVDQAPTVCANHPTSEIS